MNASNVTEPYKLTGQTDDRRVTFNLTLTANVTLIPVTYDSGDVLDNREAPSTTQTQGKSSG